MSPDAASYNGVPAYLRRIIGLLEWVTLERPGARVSFGVSEMGIWGDLGPAWRPSGSHLEMHFVRSSPPFRCRIVTAESVIGGAELVVEVRGGSRGRLRVVWEENPEEESPWSPDLESLRPWLRERFPGHRVLGESRRTDRAHTLSNRYRRILLSDGRRDAHVLLPHGGDGEMRAGEILTQALLWLEQRRSMGSGAHVPVVCLLLPEGTSAVARHRSRVVNRRRLALEVWEYGPGEGKPVVRPAPEPPPPAESFEIRWPVLGPYRWSPVLGRLLELAPHSIRRYPRFEDYDSLRLQGLEFARAHGRDRDEIVFGVGATRTPLRPDNFESLQALVNEILYYRRADSPDPYHSLFRMRAESWLESLMLENVPDLFPELRPECVYPQIPVYLGDDPGRVDILALDRDGSLVVMELKVQPDPELPLQAIDYWSRVSRHNQCGDFERRGYFSGMRLSRARPRIYLVAPVFSFHDSLERIMGWLPPDLQVWKISVNEDWRGGVRILRRDRLRGDCRK